MDEQELKKKFLESHDWEQKEGWAVNTEAMNPEGYDEIFFEGAKLEEAIEDFARKTSWWAYKPSEGEEIFEDIDDAIEYEEDKEGISALSCRKHCVSSTEKGRLRGGRISLKR